ncbi:MAG: septum site-determining protein MinC [Panacagrimonas sp.]
MTKSRPALEFKGRMLSLTRVRILNADVSAIDAQLKTFARSLGEAVMGMPVLVDADAEIDLRYSLGAILNAMRAVGLQPVGAIEGPLAAAARATGLVVLPADLVSETSQRATPVPQAPAPAPEPATVQVVSAPRRSTRVVVEPIRSGQQVYAESADLVVMNTVSPGAEVIADGCVHVYGSLRGRAIAGARGDSEARVFCRRMEAELLAVAGIYAVADQMHGALRGQAVQALLVDGTLRIEKLEG